MTEFECYSFLFADVRLFLIEFDIYNNDDVLNL